MARALDGTPLNITGASCDRFLNDPQCANQTTYSIPARELPPYPFVNNIPGFKSSLSLDMQGGFPDPNGYFGVEMFSVRYSYTVPEPADTSMLLLGLAATGLIARRRQGRG